MCRPTENFTCADCKKRFENSAYAIRPDDQKVCDDCAHAAECAAWRDAHGRGEYAYGYGPSELKVGASIQNWTGKPIATILSVGDRPHPWTIGSNWGERFYVVARTAEGLRFGGWVAPGISSRLKPKPAA